MSKKCNQSLRKKYKVKNWHEYDKSLVNRGDITIWIDKEAIQNWIAKPTGKRGRQPLYSEMAIEAAITTKLIFTKRLRQTEGFLSSIMKLMKIDLPIPDHTTISRRTKTLKIPKIDYNKPLNLIFDSTGLKVYGEGEWNKLKHGTHQRKTWRKLHITITSDGEIIAKKLTKNDIGDSSCINDLLHQVNEEVDSVYADGGYDGNPTFNKIEEYQDKIPKIIIPPKKHSQIRKDGNKQRNRHISFISKHSRKVWEIVNNYSHRLLVENAIYRYKTIIGRKLHSRNFDNQKIEAILGCNILNKMFELGKPISAPA